MTQLKIVFECEDTARNRRLAERLFDNVRERGSLPVTRSLVDPYEMGKVDGEIEVSMAVDPPEAGS